MSQSTLSRASMPTITAATISAMAVLAMTSIHHIYGAAIFETPWRLHIVFISIPVAILTVGAVALANARVSAVVSRLASWTFMLLTAGFTIGLIGIYEGGYNHLLPNLRYIAGMESGRDGLYQPPDDLIFQLTGIAQFLLGVTAAWYLVKLVRSGRNR